MSFSLTQQGGLEDSLSRTPPNFAPSSYEVGHLKRTRAGSISGRLRAASDLEEHGFIDRAQKGVLKVATLACSACARRARALRLRAEGVVTGCAAAKQDLIITGSDPQLQTALEKYERGDPTDIQGACCAFLASRSAPIPRLTNRRPLVPAAVVLTRPLLRCARLQGCCKADT